MIRILFDPDQLDSSEKAWWEDWQKRAEKETQKVIGAWERWKRSASEGSQFSYNWTSSIWTELKDWMLDHVFHGKCAYCETPKVRSQFHVDHFRPKGRARYKISGQKHLKVAQCVDTDGKMIEHPGYFWLAYNWRNLLPSCALCNTVRGKKDQFPLKCARYVLLFKVGAPFPGSLKHSPRPSLQWQDFFYLNPNDLDALEDRLLLHPYEDDPRQHLIFGDKGSVSARNGSVLGEHSIEVFNLAGEELRLARQDAQEAAETSFMIAYISKKKVDIASKLAVADATLERYRAGEEPYSAAVLDYMELVRLRLGTGSSSSGVQ